MTSIQRRIGISTLCLSSTPPWEAIRLVREAGFAGIELVPHLYGGPEAIDPAMRSRLREEMATFDVATVHSSGARLADGRRADIASADPAHREESVRHYLSLTELALDIGARLATFHAGYWTAGEATPEQRQAHMECARRLCDGAATSDLILGFEYFDAGLAVEIDSPQFGVLFDVGHAALRSEGDLTVGVLGMIGELCSLAVQYHIHGVHVAEDGRKIDHRALEESNGVDYARAIRAIKRTGFAGPLMLEIEAWSRGDPRQTLDASLRARDELARLWGES